jgi:hypothetical protein
MTTPPVELLPRDVQHQNQWLTELYRSNPRGGGRAVYLENSKPGEVPPGGFQFHVIEIVVTADNKETLGQTVKTTSNCDQAIAIAANP